MRLPCSDVACAERRAGLHSGDKDNMKPSRIYAVAIVATMVLGFVGGVDATLPSPKDQSDSDTIAPRRMPDGKQWTTNNLKVDTVGSFCHTDTERNCLRYGRLYTWESAKLACRSLGDGWRLPTNDEWQQMAKHFGGVRDDSADGGKAAFKALLIGGSSGFNAVFGGNRDADGQYARLEAHGLYWTASESDPAGAWLYNLGKNGQILNRHSGANKQMAVSVRCIRE
jgi:uncharacterized protein (TIGR02145 family)